MLKILLKNVTVNILIILYFYLKPLVHFQNELLSFCDLEIAVCSVFEF